MCGVEPRDISHITPIVTSVFMSLAIAATVVRCWESRRHFGPEDVFAILALVWYRGGEAEKEELMQNSYVPFQWARSNIRVGRSFKCRPHTDLVSG